VGEVVERVAGHEAAHLEHWQTICTEGCNAPIGSGLMKGGMNRQKPEEILSAFACN
jgi:hypothetical protein